MCPDCQKRGGFFGYLECVLGRGKSILEFEDRFWNSRLILEFWAPVQNLRDG